MLCGHPIKLIRPFGDVTVACGQCMNCRVNRRRQWAGRIMLEMALHERSSFVTLTYQDAPVALCEDMPRLVLHGKDLTLWLKKWRREYGPFRYFAVGEYGDKKERPHYHAVLFGVDPGYADLIEDSWKHGFTSTYEANKARANYIAFYTTKKWLKGDHKDLHGRPPEFARMSRKPGIGVGYVEIIANSYWTRAGSALIADGILGNVIRVEGSIYPLDPMIMTKLREVLGLPKNFGKLPNTATAEEYGEAKKKEAKLRRAIPKGHSSTHTPV